MERGCGVTRHSVDERAVTESRVESENLIHEDTQDKSLNALKLDASSGRPRRINGKLTVCLEVSLEQ